MLDNGSNMIYKWKQYSTTTTETTTTAAKAKQTQAEILTLNIKTTRTTSTLPPGQSAAATTRSALTSYLNFLIPKDGTLSSSVAAKTAIQVAKAPTKISKDQNVFTNSTPQHLLRTLRRAIATNDNYSYNKRTSNIRSGDNISSSSSSCRTHSWWNNSTNNTMKNTNVSRHVIQQNVKSDDYHMFALNYQNSRNVLQHHQQQRHQHLIQQQQRNNKPHQQQKQQHKAKRQFLLLLTCFMAIITIFSLPHLSTASPSLTVSASTSPATTSDKSATFKTTTSITTKATISIANSLTKETNVIPLLSSLSSSSFANSSNDNENSYVDGHRNDNDVVYDSHEADKLTTSLVRLETAIETSLSKSRLNDSDTVFRFIRSLEGVSTSSSSSSAIFSPSSGGSGLTNIFNQNLDTGLSNNIECPSFDENSACPCYKFEDGLFLECPGTTAVSLRTTLERISSPIHSLSIYDFDRSVTSLSQDVFQPGVNIRHLQFSHSHLETLKDNSLKNVRASLESLSIVNGKLTQIIPDDDQQS